MDNTLFFPIERKVYLKSGYQFFELNLQETTSRIYMSESSSTTTTVQADSSVTSVSTVSTSPVQQENCKIQLSKEMINAILENKSPSMEWRFYSGAHPLTFVVAGEAFQKLKELLKN